MVFVSRIGWQPPVNIYFKGRNILDEFNAAREKLHPQWQAGSVIQEHVSPDVKAAPKSREEIDLNQPSVDATLFLANRDDVPPSLMERWERLHNP